MALEVLVRGGPFPVNDKPPKYPLGMLSTHVLFKGAQAGSVLGVVLSTPYVHDPNDVCCIRRARRASMAQALPSHHPPGRSVTAGTTCGLTCVASGHFFVVLAERLPFQWYVDMQRGWAGTSRAADRGARGYGVVHVHSLGAAQLRGRC